MLNRGKGMDHFGGRAEIKTSHENLPTKLFLPELLRIANREEREKYEHLQTLAGVEVFDTLQSQLQELVKIKHPSLKLSQKETEEKIALHLQGQSLTEYGVWCYYPWSKRLVHILDEEEFIELRTSRNLYKITPEERRILGAKKIGVIGLSVGQSVSLSLAMERICGELRLADFDKLELTNLNRIRTGLHNLGLEKVYAVAREIAEIDPYLKVKCYPEGINENNIDDFFSADGNLDLMVEESDGFDIKILSRYKARALGIPVIMEASDRCMVDVERFDLEPARPILHGLVKHLDVEQLKSLKTTEEKIPFMLDILGIDTCSERLRASMIEIDQSIGTWPQLASAVAMGGGITADVCRRILLKQFNASGRYHVDIEEIIGEENKRKVNSKSDNSLRQNPYSIPPREKNSVDGPEESTIMNLIEDAIKAPSAGNNQPWKWYYNGANLYLFHDKQRSQGWTDPDDQLAMMALGAALENLKLSAGKKNLSCNISFPEQRKDNEPVARISFQKTTSRLPQSEDELFEMIGKRCTNRKKGESLALNSAQIDAIKAVVHPPFYFEVVENQNQIETLADIIAETEKIRFMHPEGHDEFFRKEIRWNEKEAKESKDGIDLATLELSFLDQTGMKISSDEKVMQLLRDWGGGNGLKKISRTAVLHSSALGLISGNPDFPNNYLAAGMAVQRAWLKANQLQLSVHPVSSPVFFFDRIKRHRDLPRDTIEQIRQMESLFQDIFPSAKKQTPFFLFRLSKADAPTAYSLRIPAEDCIIHPAES